MNKIQTLLILIVTALLAFWLGSKNPNFKLTVDGIMSLFSSDMLHFNEIVVQDKLHQYEEAFTKQTEKNADKQDLTKYTAVLSSDAPKAICPPDTVVGEQHKKLGTWEHEGQSWRIRYFGPERPEEGNVGFSQAVINDKWPTLSCYYHWQATSGEKREHLLIVTMDMDSDRVVKPFGAGWETERRCGEYSPSRKGQRPDCIRYFQEASCKRGPKGCAVILELHGGEREASH